MRFPITFPVPVRQRTLLPWVCIPVFWLGVFGVGCTGCESAPESAESGFTIVIPRIVESLDPRFIRDPYGIKVSRLIHASLFTMDPHTLEVVGDLALSHRFVSPTVVEVELRTDATFSDGSTLDSADVVATYEGILDPAVGSAYAGGFRRFSAIEALGPWRVRLTLRAPHATVLTDLEFPILREQDAHRLFETDSPPIGAGPYVLDRWTGQRVVLHARDSTKPTLVFLVVRDDNTRALRLQAGAADVALNAVPPLLIPMFEEDPRFEVLSRPGIGTSYLGFNMEAPPLNDLRVRQAVAHAIDVPLLIAAEREGYADPTTSWIPRSHWAHLEAEALPYDPPRARRLLHEAGAEGASLILRTSSDRARLSICRAIAAMLREVGLEVEVRPSESATLIADLNAGRFELTFLQVPEVFEPHTLHWFFASERIPENGHFGANRWRLRDEALDAALERGRASNERSERLEAYHEVQRRLWAQLPVFPLWQEQNVAVVRRGVDYDLPQDGRFRTMGGLRRTTPRD